MSNLKSNLKSSLTSDCPVKTRLKELGIELTQSPNALANYLPYQISATTIYISGQGPITQSPNIQEKEILGKLGKDVSIERGNQAAQMAAVNILSVLHTALDGDFSRVKQCLKLGGFVNAAEHFTDHPQVINGASDLIADVFADRGRHARFAIGVASLPRNWAVEIDAIFELSKTTL